MLGSIEICKEWQEKAREAYLSQDEKKFEGLDIQIKGTFMLSVLKSNHGKLKDMNSLLIHFFAWAESPRTKKWEKGWQIIYGWYALSEVAGVLNKEETVAQTVLEVSKRKHFKEILMAIVKSELIRQSELAFKLDLKENNLIPKIDSLIEMRLVGRQKVSGASFISPTSRGYAVAEPLQEQMKEKSKTNSSDTKSLPSIRKDKELHIEYPVYLPVKKPNFIVYDKKNNYQERECIPIEEQLNDFLSEAM